MYVNESQAIAAPSCTGAQQLRPMAWISKNY